MSLSLYDRDFFVEYGARNEAYRSGCRAVAEEIHRMIRPRSAVDWGCGAGLHAERLGELGVAVVAIDAVLAPPDLCGAGIEVRLHDLRDEAPPGLVSDIDLAVCLDVLEHVEPESETIALANVVRGARTVVLSCAPPGQRGTGHVNERPRRHWIALMRALGFGYDRRASGRLSLAVRARPEVPFTWMSKNLAVYRRENARHDEVPLQKWLARRAGLPKRAAREAVRLGRVTVEGVAVRRFAEPVPGGARVSLDGRTIEPGSQRAWFLLHKPRKHLCTLEPPDRPDGLGRYLPADAPRLFLVGRLDFASEGAILLTDDGDLARRVLHPASALPRVYRVKVRDRLAPDDAAIGSMRAPIRIGRRVLVAREVAWESLRTRATWIRVVLGEGAHGEIRALCRRARLQIVKLRREAIGPVLLGDLRPRCVRRLGDEEVAALRAALHSWSIESA